MAPHAHPPLTPFGSALAGALGSVFANAAVYPLDTVKTRLQAQEEADDDDDDAESVSDSDSELGADEASKAVIQDGDAENGDIAPTTIQVNSPTKAKSRSIKGSKQSPSSHVQVLKAYASQKLKKWGMLMLLIRIIRKEGLSGAFHGFGASMIGTFSQQFAYFFFHSLLRSTYIKRLSTRSLPLPGTSSKGVLPPAVPISLSTSAELLLGAAAGALAQIFTIPVQVIATRQQLWRPPHQHQHQHHHHPHSHDSQLEGGKRHGKVSVHAPTLFETASEIIEEKGITGLWTGLRPGLVLTVNPAITYGAFERLKTWRLAQRQPTAPGLQAGQGVGKLGVAESFWLGVGSKTLATVVTYPYIFAKVRLQAKAIPDEADEDFGKDLKTEQSPSLQASTLQPGNDAHSDDQAAASPDTNIANSDSASSTATSASASAPSYASIASAPPAFGSAVITPADPAVHSGSTFEPAPNSMPVQPRTADNVDALQRPPLTARRSSHHHQHYDDALTLLRAVYKEHGWRGWYQGLGAQITKAVLCQGILFVSKDQFESYAWLLLVFFANLRKKLALV